LLDVVLELEELVPEPVPEPDPVEVSLEVELVSGGGGVLTSIRRACISYPTLKDGELAACTTAWARATTSVKPWVTSSSVGADDVTLTSGKIWMSKSVLPARTLTILIR